MCRFVSALLRVQSLRHNQDMNGGGEGAARLGGGGGGGGRGGGKQWTWTHRKREKEEESLGMVRMGVCGVVMGLTVTMYCHPLFCLLLTVLTNHHSLQDSRRVEVEDRHHITAHKRYIYTSSL